MTKYFVWIANIHGTPEPQIWHGKQVDGNGKAKATLFMKELDVYEDMLSVHSLVAKYPYVGKQE